MPRTLSDEPKTLMSMFLLASAQKDLSMCSFRLFGVQKPKEEEVWSTEVTKEDLKNAVVDEFGVKYSKDWKRLLKAPSGLKGEYSIRKGVKIIGDSAFGGCESLSSINIPNSVTNIGNRAFGWCDSLKSINIPSSVVYMDGNPFYKWDGNLHNESKAFVYEHQVLFSKDKTTLIAYKSYEINYIIPDSVTNIGNHAFSNCELLTSINIPDGVTNIGDYAFYGCESLNSINIPNSVTNIGNGTFCRCESLKSINIPSSVVNMNGNPFLGWDGDLYNESKAFVYEHQVLWLIR